MIECELRRVVLHTPLAEEGGGPTVVQDERSEQHDAPILEEVRPDERVCGGIVQLADRQVVRRTKMLPDKVVGIVGGKYLDLMPRTQLTDERGGVIEQIRRIWRVSSKPGHLHGL